MSRPTRKGNFPGDTEESPPGTEWYWDGHEWQLSEGLIDSLEDAPGEEGGH